MLLGALAQFAALLLRKLLISFPALVQLPALFRRQFPHLAIAFARFLPFLRGQGGPLPHAVLDLLADGGFEEQAPVEHGDAPITAVHDPGLLAFLRDAWAEARRANHPYEFLAPETLRCMAATSHVLTHRSAATRAPDVPRSLAAIRIHDVAAAGLAAVLVLSVGLTDGGYYGHAYTALTVLLGAGSLLAVLGGVTRRPSRVAMATLVLLGLLTAWMGLSALWAVPGAGVELEARRSVLYLVALASVMVIVDARRRRAFVTGLLAAVVFVALVAIVMRAASGTPEDRFYGSLLEEPVGYPNALGVLVAIGAVLALGLGARRGGSTARSARATAPFLVFVLGLTGSRGAGLALGVGIALLLALAPGPARRPLASSLQLMRTRWQRVRRCASLRRTAGFLYISCERIDETRST